MNQDALERLRNRARPTVESRDLSIIPSISNDDEETSNHEVGTTLEPTKDILNSSNQDLEISTSKDIEKASASAKLASNKLSSSSMDIKTKQSTIRLEQKLSQRLSQKCQEVEISREVFLEALFLYFENHKSIQPKVIQEARKRDQQRQKIANYRRAKSMIERFGSE